MSGSNGKEGEGVMVGAALRMAALMAETSLFRGGVRRKAFSNLGVDRLMALNVDEVAPCTRPATILALSETHLKPDTNQ